MTNLYFNILTFEQPNEELTLYFTDKENTNLIRLYHTIVPDEVIQKFGQQEHYYTSFQEEKAGFFPVTKAVEPNYEKKLDKHGEEYSSKVRNSAFSIAILKRYYNNLIHDYFKTKGLLVKPNFISDTEVWLPSKEYDKTGKFKQYDRYCLRVQFQTVTKHFELLLTFQGTSKVYKQSVEEMQEEVSPSSFNWVIFNNALYKFEELSDEGRRAYDQVFPVWNLSIRNDKNESIEAPERGNKYIKFKNAIDNFYKEYLNKEEFKTIIPINSNSFIPVDGKRIGSVTPNSNQLLFGNKNKHIVPIIGINQYGPYDTGTTPKVHFFYIVHKDDKQAAETIHKYLNGKAPGFKGLSKFIHIPYHPDKKLAIYYTDKTNPWPEVYAQINDTDFDPDIKYFAIYVSPISKDATNIEQKRIYYRIKELLLKKGVSSQVIDAIKLSKNKKPHYNLPNIAIAILAKLNGTPWRLDSAIKRELVVGVGAFKNPEFDIQYVGGAFSFSNNGKFNRFECFQKDQTKELAGSIYNAVKEYAAINPEIKRLVIHFYKTMSREELEPIEKGLKSLGLDIPVFIISINKTESSDIIAFDTSWENLMPLSGSYINIGYNKFLLFNNTRYDKNIYKSSEGFPFPIKLKIECTQPELIEDIKTVKELIDQVYQFSRMYWKSVSQQNLPVTIKYSEMVAEMLPYFDGYEIPEFGKNHLWFL
jgi:hypothetical protein